MSDPQVIVDYLFLFLLFLQNKIGQISDFQWARKVKKKIDKKEELGDNFEKTAVK